MRSMRSEARSRAGSERAEGAGASRKSILHTTTNTQAPPALSLESLAQMGMSEPRRSELRLTCTALTGLFTHSMHIAHRGTRGACLALSFNSSAQRRLSERGPRRSREEWQHQGRQRARRAHASRQREWAGGWRRRRRRRGLAAAKHHTRVAAGAGLDHAVTVRAHGPSVPSTSRFLLRICYRLFRRKFHPCTTPHACRKATHEARRQIVAGRTASLTPWRQRRRPLSRRLCERRAHGDAHGQRICL
jgi:hypothetical protein